MWQRIKSCLAIVGIICCTAFACPGGRWLPAVEVKTLEGRTVDISQVSNQGKPMVVIAWEITCQPCIKEFNAIAPLYESWQKETGVKIVAVSTDDNRSSPRVKPMVRSKGWPFEVYLDPNQAFKRAMNIPVCPYAFVLNGAGEVVWQKSGYNPGDEYTIYEVVKKTAAGQAVE